MSAQHPPSQASPKSQSLCSRESWVPHKEGKVPELRRCPWSWSDARPWGFFPSGPRSPLLGLLWCVSPWMGLPLGGGAPPGWTSTWWVSPWRVGLPLDGPHPGGSPLDGSPPGGWVSPWRVGLLLDRSHPGGPPLDGSPPGGSQWLPC